MTLGPVRYPEILSKSCSVNRAELSVRIPEDLAYCEGHFPNIPIVPGVVQLHWAVKFAQEIFKISGPVSQGKQIKFSNLMRPKDELFLILEYSSEKSLVLYQYKSEKKAYSSGRFTVPQVFDE